MDNFFGTAIAAWFVPPDDSGEYHSRVLRDEEIIMLVKINVNGIVVECDACDVGTIMASLAVKGGRASKTKKSFDTSTARKLEGADGEAFKTLMSRYTGEGASKRLIAENGLDGYAEASPMFSAYRAGVKTGVYYLSPNASRAWDRINA